VSTCAHTFLSKELVLGLTALASLLFSFFLSRDSERCHLNLTSLYLPPCHAAITMGPHLINGHAPPLRHIDLSYNPLDSDRSAHELIYRIQPKWREGPGDIEIVKFTDGITNNVCSTSLLYGTCLSTHLRQLLKISKRRPGLTQSEIDRESILLRAYGNNTEILIDRDREATSHALCAELGLASPLLARFNNGLLYRYIIGQVCTPKDLVLERVWRGVARRLGEWHARLPVDSVSGGQSNVSNGANDCSTTPPPASLTPAQQQPSHSDLASRMPVPNIWSVMQKWTEALPCASPKQQARKDLLQQELERSFHDLDNSRGLGKYGFVFGHGDLLSANVIMLPPSSAAGSKPPAQQEVAFIDYEYATPCPAAFDIANHFAEWGGYDCDYNMLPTRSVRREFLQEYLQSYQAHSDEDVPDTMLELLLAEVDRYRGMPGLYWGIWALIQATISQIDFDYASYAEVRLGEYFAWRTEGSGSATGTAEKPLRERRWAEN